MWGVRVPRKAPSNATVSGTLRTTGDWILLSGFRDRRQALHVHAEHLSAQEQRAQRLILRTRRHVSSYGEMRQEIPDGRRLDALMGAACCSTAYPRKRRTQSA